MMDEVKLLLIEAACTRLSLLASRYMDIGQFDDFAAQFTEDGEFVRPSTYPSSPLIGRTEIARVLQERFGGFTSRHICSNLIVDVLNESKATATSSFLHLSDNGDGSTPPISLKSSFRSMGEYFDEYFNTAQGWRIKRRVGRFLFR
jgi:hypothetical protein